MDIIFANKGIGDGILSTIPGDEWEDILKDRNQHRLVADIPLVSQRSRRRKVK
jgi:hypothetical protein